MNTKTKIQAVVKRDGRSAAFGTEKIAFAIFKALRATGKPSRENANTYCSQVIQQLEQLQEETPTV